MSPVDEKKKPLTLSGVAAFFWVIGILAGVRVLVRFNANQNPFVEVLRYVAPAALAIALVLTVTALIQWLSSRTQGD